jgi:hypothetical protein
VKLTLTTAEAWHLLSALNNIDHYYGPREQFEKRHMRLVDKLETLLNTPGDTPHGTDQVSDQES